MNIGQWVAIALIGVGVTGTLVFIALAIRKPRRPKRHRFKL